MSLAVDAKRHGIAEIHKGTHGIIDAGLEYSFSALRSSSLIVSREVRDHVNLGREAIMGEAKTSDQRGTWVTLCFPYLSARWINMIRLCSWNVLLVLGCLSSMGYPILRDIPLPGIYL